MDRLLRALTRRRSARRQDDDVPAVGRYQRRRSGGREGARDNAPGARVEREEMTSSRSLAGMNGEWTAVERLAAFRRSVGS
jgi:hypothetical protein